jgi:hypothetical protein
MTAYTPATVRVLHGPFGCECGCCGHSVAAYDSFGQLVASSFIFDHPIEHGDAEWAQRIAAEHFPGIPLDIPSSWIRGLFCEI